MVQTTRNKNTNNYSTLKPNEIKDYLDEYVVGQDEAKRLLSVAVYNHFKRIAYNESNQSNLVMEKSNIILLGPTGCGKTLLVKCIAKLLGVPCYIQDCTKITASGYVGSDVEDCIAGLLRSCKYNLSAAEHGIVILDEGDKIARKEVGTSVMRDVSGECVQQSLLKILEGDLIGVPPAGGRKYPEQPLIYVDTTNILFILSGAFVGLEDIIKKRLEKEGRIADRTNPNTMEQVLWYVSPMDMRTFGFIPEFIGRFPIITSVRSLTQEDFVSILKESKNALLKQYVELMKMDRVELSFTDGAIREIAQLAIDKGSGARGLRGIVETVLTDIMFEYPQKAAKTRLKTKVCIDENYVDKKIESIHANNPISVSPNK